MDCARAIVQSGIRRLVASKPQLSDERWSEHFSAALQLFEELNFEIDWITSNTFFHSE